MHAASSSTGTTDPGCHGWLHPDSPLRPHSQARSTERQFKLFSDLSIPETNRVSLLRMLASFYRARQISKPLPDGVKPPPLAAQQHLSVRYLLQSTPCSYETRPRRSSLCSCD